MKLETFTENWDSKVPSVGTLLAYLESTKIRFFFFFLGIKLCCFLRWNFQHLSQNFYSFNSFRQFLFPLFSIPCLIELKFCKVSNWCWKFQKKIIPKKMIQAKRVPTDDVCCPNFQWRFWWNPLRQLRPMPSHFTLLFFWLQLLKIT